MALGNALNITSTGIVKLDAATGLFTATTTTDHAVLIGAAANAITNVGPVASTGAVLMSNGASSDPGFSTATYPLTTTVSQILYSSATNTITGLASANSGVLTTDASGVPSIDTTNFVRQTTGMQVKGNNTNTAPPAGFLGEQITSGYVSYGALSNGTPVNVTSISLTAGVWDITGMIFFNMSSAVQSQVATSVSTVSATLQGNVGDQTSNANATQGQATPIVPAFRVLLSSTTTYYLVGQANFSAGTASAAGRISAVRVG